MAKKKRRRSKKSSRRQLTKKLFGGSRDSFDGKQSGGTAGLFAVGIGLLLVGAFFWYMSSGSQEVDSGSSTSQGEVETGNLMKDYREIVDNGSLAQRSRLLLEMNYANLESESVPVRLDHYKKIVDLAARIVETEGVDEEVRVEAMRSKLEANWRAYAASINNELNDPFIADQLFIGVDEAISDPDPGIVRKARILQANGIVSETIGNRSRGSYDKVQEELKVLLTQYPNDPIATETVKSLFTKIRAANAKESAKLAHDLAVAAESSEFGESQKLALFMNDIIALYDSGIGNLDKIGDIIVDDQDFMSRLVKLNDDLSTGKTVVTQLDNAIEFFERQRKHDLALELSNKVLANAGKRNDPDAAKLAELVGKYGVTRNSLFNKPWVFDGVDQDGVPIDPEKFKDRITLVVYYPITEPMFTSVSKSLSKMEAVLNRSGVEIIRVKVGDGEPENAKSGPLRGRVKIRSSTSNPHEYFVRCPTNRLPYAVLIDSKGIVDTINVSLKNVKSRIEYLLSTN